MNLGVEAQKKRLASVWMSVLMFILCSRMCLIIQQLPLLVQQLVPQQQPHHLR